MIVGVGECSIDEVWQVEGAIVPGQKAQARGVVRMGGGQIATAMVACARLERKSAYLGAVGDDDEGRFVVEGLEREGVDTRGVQRVQGGATRRALVLVGQGQRTIVEHRHGATRINPLLLDLERIRSAHVVHVDGTDFAASLLVAKAAKAAGVKISVDLDAPHPHLDELLALADLCFVAETLLPHFAETGDLKTRLLALQSRCPGLVGVTLGEHGAAALDRGHLVLSPAFANEVVDTTACGDTFHAAAIVALLDERSVPDLLRFANAAASLKCRALGRAGCPTRAEVEALVARG